MKLKNKTKFLLVIGIIFVSFLLFNTNMVNATEISDYKCKIEKNGYIFYNNYFNTNDVDIEIKNGKITINKSKVEQSKLNNLVNDIKGKKENKLLVELTDNVISVNLKDTTENLEIIEQNGKKYVVINAILELMEDDNVQVVTMNKYNLEINKNGTTETKEIDFNLYLEGTDYFQCLINVVSDKGVVYGTSVNKNGIINGMGMGSIPSNIDLSDLYVEYLANQYIGKSIKIDCLGNVPYVGKYGDRYKYKANLKNVKLDSNDGQNLDKFSYKNSQGCGGFIVDPNYIANNEIYVENKETNTDTKLKFDLQGNFKGTIKAEEISKSDLIYGKVEENLNIEENLHIWIGNIYIENGSFEGNLKLTFNVGEQYNGKNYLVAHMNNEKYEFEEFTGIVKDGKIEIIVDNLSPFGISIFENKTTTETDNTQENQKPTQPTNKGEKDETPKTGTIDIIGYVLLVTTLAGVGIVTLKKKIK